MSSAGIYTAIAAGGFLLILFVVLIAVAWYVVTALGIYKILNLYGYDKAWLAWIPYGQYYALGDVACGGAEALPMFGKDLPALLYKLWWIGTFVVSFVPAIGTWLGIAIRVLFLGTVFTKIFMDTENKTLEDARVIGYISGFIPIVGVIKFFSITGNSSK